MSYVAFFFYLYLSVNVTIFFCGAYASVVLSQRPDSGSFNMSSLLTYLKRKYTNIMMKKKEKILIKKF
jgi:hypothetical protein